MAAGESPRGDDGWSLPSSPHRRTLDQSVSSFVNQEFQTYFIRVLQVKSLSHVRLCDPMDYTVPGILQARVLEWVAFPFSRGSSQPGDRTQVSHIAGGFFIS